MTLDAPFGPIRWVRTLKSPPRLARTAQVSRIRSGWPRGIRRIRADMIREHWGEVLRLVASLKAVAVLPSAMLRKLAAYWRQNQLDLAL